MKQITILLILILGCITLNGQLIVDNGKFFSDKEKSDLTTKLKKIEDKSTVQTLIYTTMDLGGKTSLVYGKELSLKYRVGKKGVNNGIIILFSKNDRKLQILNGYGLEWFVSDIQSQEIVDQMSFYFKKGEFYNGLGKAIDMINSSVVNIDWKTYKYREVSKADNGKIFKIDYSNKSGKTKYKYAIDTDPQFSNDFKIKLTIEGKHFDLYYSKYMNDLVSEILTSDNIIIYFRLSDFEKRRLELVGVE